MGCIAPSVVVSPGAAAAFGLVAEGVIASRYLAHRGKSSFFPASTRDFQDILLGFGNTALFISFLKANNRLSTSQMLALSAHGLVPVPDLMTHDGARREFYEIKPNSIDGRAAGQVKIASLAALFGFAGLGYRPGTIWKASERILLWSGLVVGARIEAYLHFFPSPTVQGLILYELCVEGELQKALERIALSVLLATVVVLVLTTTAPVLVVVAA
jgi:hypothetical protein